MAVDGYFVGWRISLPWFETWVNAGGRVRLCLQSNGLGFCEVRRSIETLCLAASRQATIGRHDSVKIALLVQPVKSSKN